MAQFDVSNFSSQIFWLVLVFGLLYLNISKLVTPVTEQIFKNRKTVINQAVDEAELIALKTEALKKDFNVQYRNILNSAEDIRKETASNLDKSFLEKKHILLDELTLKRQKYLEELNQDSTEFLSTQSDSCIDLAKFIILKITNKKPDLTLLKSCYERVK